MGCAKPFRNLPAYEKRCSSASNCWNEAEQRVLAVARYFPGDNRVDEQPRGKIVGRKPGNEVDQGGEAEFGGFGRQWEAENYGGHRPEIGGVQED